MPTYDYRCQDCHKRVSVFQTYAEYGTTPVLCPECGSARLVRRIGRVRIARSEDARLESLADPSNFGDLDENDPRSMGRMMRKMKEEMGSEMGDDMGPELDEAIERLEAGQSPEDIEREMPELAGDETGMACMGGMGGMGGMGMGDMDDF